MDSEPDERQEKRFIGLMSGTSVDGIDAVLASFTADETRLHKTHAEPFPPALQSELQQLIAEPEHTSLEQVGRLNGELSQVYATAVRRLLAAADTAATDVAAIGCHGQTVLHSPDSDPRFTLQLVDGAALAVETGIATVTDLRSADMALGGQGAPLAPAFHAWAFGRDALAAVINIGGIGNITVLHPERPVSGYDTGPGNTLLDAWCQEHTGSSFDNSGVWGRRGAVDNGLLKRLLADPYFSRTPPKSTGREYFHRDWLDTALAAVPHDIAPADVQATLTELTATTIATAVIDSGANEVWLCGGGAANDLLVERLTELCGGARIATTAELGVDPDWVEAVAFAWFARERLAGRAAGCPSVTGASQAAVLGALHLPAPPPSEA